MAKKRKKKKSATKRVSAALTRWLKQQNPAFKKATAVRVKRLKGGTMTFTPIRSNPAYELRDSNNKTVAWFETKKKAQTAKRNRELSYGGRLKIVKVKSPGLGDR